MNLPGRANRKVPLDSGTAFEVSDFFSCCWVNSPLAALVVATKVLNWSRAPALAAPARLSAAAKMVKDNLLIGFLVLDFNNAYSAEVAGTRMSRLPFDCIGDTTPLFSICSSRRAARL